MNYNFRLRFDLVEGMRLNSNETKIILDCSSTGAVLTLISGALGEPISAHPYAAIVGGPYPCEETAGSIAGRARDILLVWAVRHRFGIDLGDGKIHSALTEAGKTHFGQMLGKPVRNDLQGIDVYPADQNTVLLRLASKVEFGKSVESLSSEIHEIESRSWWPSEKQRVAAELFCASFFDRVYRSRFITLVTAVETLLQPHSRSVSIQRIVDQAKVLADALSDLEPAKKSLLSGLERLRNESIGQAGRHLADNLLRDRTYEGMAPGKFFSKCYSIRSQTVHNGSPDDSDINFHTLSNSCHMFVGDLLQASFAAHGAS